MSPRFHNYNHKFKSATRVMVGSKDESRAGARDTDTLRAPGTLSFLSYYKGTNNYLYIAKTIDHVPVGRNAAKGDMREAT